MRSDQFLQPLFLTIIAVFIVACSGAGGPGDAALDAGAGDANAVVDAVDAVDAADAVDTADVLDAAPAPDAPADAPRDASPALVALTVTPASATLQHGATDTVRLSALARFDDGSARDVSDEATWRLSAPDVASVSNTAGARGLVTASAAQFGDALVTATLGAQTSAPARVHVLASTLTALEVTPPTTTLCPGAGPAFHATATYADGRTEDATSRVIWSSSDAAVATVAPDGTSQALAGGTALIRASLAGLTREATLTVTADVPTMLSITPASSSVVQGDTLAFQAQATFTCTGARDVTALVTWSSSAPSIATIDATGVATGLAPGTADLRATPRSMPHFLSYTATATLTVTAP